MGNPLLQEAELCLKECPPDQELSDDNVRLFMQRCRETQEQIDAAVATGYHLLARYVTEIMLVILNFRKTHFAPGQWSTSIIAQAGTVYFGRRNFKDFLRHTRLSKESCSLF